MPNPKRHYRKKKFHDTRPRATICCPRCGLPSCQHGLCINNECDGYEKCDCEKLYGSSEPRGFQGEPP